jgi:Arc/MetJ-type ribon-helix-helix transcriptional regulator
MMEIWNEAARLNGESKMTRSEFIRRAMLKLLPKMVSEAAVHRARLAATALEESGAAPWDMVEGRPNVAKDRPSVAEERPNVADETLDVLAANGPYELRDDGVIIDVDGAAMANCRPNRASEETEWDRALVAALNAVSTGQIRRIP